MRTAMEDARREQDGEPETNTRLLTHKGNANQWADKEKSAMQFGYDADEAAERWWREGGEQVIGSLAS